MEVRFLPLRLWIKAGIWAILLHTVGALCIDYLAWRSGLVYQVMAGQLLLLAGGVWLLSVLFIILIRLRKWGYLDPLRIILWVIGVSLLSAPLKGAGEWLMGPFLEDAYAAYPEKRAAALRDYLRKRQIEPQRIEEVIAFQNNLFRTYLEKSKNVAWVIWSKVKVLGILGVIYALILGLILRGGGSAVSPPLVQQEGNVSSAASS
ncbi:MAG: hypothetical protein RMJ66_05540 [Bacteroidia bacterium]|nr:hypothetical protein [Bacteroidia bacterium]MDW8134512.1 hypothetical protein [Bacteroidia bacterium]